MKTRWGVSSPPVVIKVRKVTPIMSCRNPATVKAVVRVRMRPPRRISLDSFLQYCYYTHTTHTEPNVREVSLYLHFRESTMHRCVVLCIEVLQKEYFNTYFLMAVTTLLKAYSQAYILITLIPVITSFMTRTRLSVCRADLNLETNTYS